MPSPVQPGSNPKHGPSIRRALRTRLLIGLSLWFAVLGGGLYALVRYRLVGQFDAGMAAKAGVLALLVKQEGPGEIEVDFAEDPMPEFERANAPEYFELWLPDGTVLARSASLRGADLALGPDARARPAFWDLALPDGRQGRAVALELRPIEESDAKPARGPLPVIRLVVARERGALDDALFGLSLALGGAGILLLLGAVVVVARAITRGLAPLGDIADRTRAIDAGSLDARFPTEGVPEEMRAVSHRLNDLLARLGASFARERRFNADVAHELRTPIAELRTLAEVALRWPEDREGTTRALTDALAIATQMERLVSSLLALARCEGGHLPVNLEPVDLAEAIRQAGTAAIARASARGLHPSFDLPNGATVATDRSLLASILGNVIGNAVEHAPEGDAIACALVPLDGGFRLDVTNAAPGLEEADLPHLYEPFWRKDAARTDGSHSGIGLALVAALARRLGIETATRLDAGRLCVSLRFVGATNSPAPAASR